MPLSGYFKPATGIPASDLSQSLRVAGERALYLGNANYRDNQVLGSLIGTNITAQASGIMNVVGIPLFAGDVVTSLSFVTGATALTMGSNVDGHLWFALYNPAGNLLSQSADQGGAATWTTNSIKTLALGAAQTIAADGWHYAVSMVNSGTGGSPAVPTYRGTSIANTILSAVAGWPTGRKVLVASSSSALTDTAPAGPLTLTAITNTPYVLAS